MPSDYCTIRDLSFRSSLCERTIRKLIREGEIAMYRLKPGGKMLVRWRDFEKWLETKRIRIAKDVDAKEILQNLLKRSA